MKHVFLLIGFIICAVFLFPSAIMLNSRTAPPAAEREGSPKVLGAAEPQTVSVYFHKTGEVKELPLEEYLVGVVSAEMPASFESEALKAQAVAARSYTVRKMAQSPPPEHSGAPVCTDSAHCSAYISKEDAFVNWGVNAEENYDKISSAVSETRGEVLYYGGDVALAAFHAAGNGKTESCADIWGGDYPYLVSVDSPGDAQYVNFASSADVGFEEFKQKIAAARAGVSIASPDDISLPVLSQSGRVKSVVIGGASFSGTEIRTIFGLRSASFTIAATPENVHFDVTGYGHGVGMSQYGANAMAKEGKSYAEILKHYYTGVDIKKAG